MIAPSKAAKPHIALVISSLGPGGAERVISLLANQFIERNYRVTLITLSDRQTDHYGIRPEINRICLNLLRDSRNPFESLRNNFHRFLEIRRAVLGCRADCVISFIEDTNIRVLLSLLGSGVPVIVSERTDPRHYQIGWLRGALRRLLYPLAQAVVVQTDGVRRWAEQFLRADKVIVIPNPISSITSSDSEDVQLREGEHTVVAVGRMGKEKGFDLLLEAFARSNIASEGWQLLILGEGQEREVLAQQATHLGIAPNVHMPGKVSEPRTWLRKCGFFVLSSRFEGFPNALLEAMAEGLPVIAFDCESGPAEIIRHGVDGVLVAPENIDALSAAIRNMAVDQELRLKLSLRSADVIQRFNINNITRQWEELIVRSCFNKEGHE